MDGVSLLKWILEWYYFRNRAFLKLSSSCQQHRCYHLTPLEPTDDVFGFNKTLDPSGRGGHQKPSRRRCKSPGHYIQVSPRLTPHSTNTPRGNREKKNKEFRPQALCWGFEPVLWRWGCGRGGGCGEGRRRARALNTISCCSLYWGLISAFRFPILLKLLLPNFVAPFCCWDKQSCLIDITKKKKIIQW